MNKEEDKWHDLRKNPKDLPEERKDVLIQYTWGDFDVKHLEWNKEWWGNGTYCGFTGVVAWKEITPPKQKLPRACATCKSKDTCSAFLPLGRCRIGYKENE